MPDFPVPRPLLIRLAFIACAILGLGALAMVSRHAIALENARRQAIAETDAAERIRLALWRIDSMAAVMMMRENSRAPGEFRQASTPAGAPNEARLYFEIDGSGGLSAISPADSPARSALVSLLGLAATPDVADASAIRMNQFIAQAAANATQSTIPIPDIPDASTATTQPLLPTLQEKQQRAKLVQQATNSITQIPSDPDALPSAAANTNAPTESSVTPLQPVWLDGELFLVRAVGPADNQRVQGIWMDSGTLAVRLGEGIRDLLPAARLSPYQPLLFTPETITHPATAAGLGESRLRATPRSLDQAPMAMLGLPWELIPGPLPSPDNAPASPLRLLLGLAWTGATLAILAAAILLHGVLALSDRRADFVSAVTHELRTPLTTFTLYSEMLASGMIRDPAKQQEYLDALQRESIRLGHLVENVLAYSRLERGGIRHRTEEIDVRALVDRLLPRAADRAAAVGASLHVDLPDSLATCRLRTDPGAVEQIVFNLIDNAAKYAPPAPGDEPWTLSVSSRRRHLVLALRDHGPGIPASDRRRLFRPFHKSAGAAANSRPGVGLGLALSRRLARAMGGDLSLASTGPAGSVFELRLPVA